MNQSKSSKDKVTEEDNNDSELDMDNNEENIKENIFDDEIIKEENKIKIKDTSL